MNYTDELWAAIDQVYSKILKHPFIEGLTSGKLAEKAFQFYVVQDALYLQDFGRGLAILGAKAPEDLWLMMFCEHAKGAIIVERALHESFFKNWKLSDESVYSTPKAPNNLLYTSYLIKTALDRPFYEGLGAFLPCYWIYLEVGKYLEKKGSQNPLYKQWIQTYASDEFAQLVNQVLDIMNGVAVDLTASQKEAVKQHFIMTSKFEYMFWDMGYRQQMWDV